MTARAATNAASERRGRMRQVRRTLAPIRLAAIVITLVGACSTAPTASTTGTAPASSETAAPPPPTPAPTSAATAAPAWAGAGRMTETRVGGSSTLLQDGRVLVAGGFADGNANDVRASAELFDPESGTWSRTGDMLHARAGQTAILLTDGTVLVAGGGTTPTDALDSTELYDPATGTWSATGKLRAPLTNAAATLLLDGRVLLVGGDSNADAQVTAELYDPSKRAWSLTGLMSEPRSGPTATRLWTGRVLVAGGAADATPLASADLFDPETETFVATGSMADPRVAHSAAILGDGRVLVAGGLRGGMAGDLAPGDILASAEIFDPVTGTWSTTGSMSESRFQFTLTSLADGRALAAVGDHLGNGPVPGAERFDPGTGRWAPAGTMVEPRAAQTATLLQDGDVLLAGGEGPGARGLASAETFDGPASARLVLANGGTMFPGIYETAFDPPMTITIDHEVDLDCAPGYRCRGDIDVNLPQWVGFEFGNVHGSELDIFRLDRVYARGDSQTPVNIPADVVAWFQGLPGINVQGDAIETRVGGLPAARFDAQPTHVVPIGPSGLADIDQFGINGGADARAWVTVLRVDDHLVVIAELLGPENTIGDFEAAVRGLDPIIASIVWE